MSELAGGYNSTVSRTDTGVRRSMGPWSAGVHDVLRQLEASHVRLAPRLLRVSEGWEELEFIEGEVGLYPLARSLRSDQALESVGRSVGELHTALRLCEPPEGSLLQTRGVEPDRKTQLIHGDLGPYNTIFDGVEVKAFIDWDFACMGTVAWDLAYAAYRFVPLSADGAALKFGWTEAPDRSRRLQLLLNAYGPDRPSPQELIDCLIARIAGVLLYLRRGFREEPERFRQRLLEDHAQAYELDLEFICSHRQLWGA